MKTILLIGALALSLAANVWLASSRDQSVSVSPLPITTASAAASAKSSAGRSAASQNQAITWASLQHGDDLAKLVAGLRAAGFPENAVRLIVQDQLHRRSLARRNKIFDSSATPYWRLPEQSPGQAAAFRALEEEDRASLVSLGIDPDTPEWRATLIRELGNLPSEKITAIIKINRDYAELFHQLAYRNTLSAEETTAQHRLLEKENRKDLVAALTPAELEEYDLRTSNTARSLIFSLNSAAPTEDEFRTLFKIAQAYEQSHPPLMGEISPDQLDDQAAAQREWRRQVRATLGDTRFVSYLGSRSSAYSDFVRFTETRSDISTNQLVALVDGQDSLVGTLARVQSQPGLSDREIHAAQTNALIALRAQLTAQLGVEAMNAFLKGNYGDLSATLKRDLPPSKN